MHFASAAYASSVLLPVFLLPACYLIELYTILGAFYVLSRPFIYFFEILENLDLTVLKNLKLTNFTNKI